MKRHFFTFIIFLLFVNFAICAEDFKIEEETWTILKLDGQRIGYSSEILLHSSSGANEKWKKEGRQKFKMKRLESVIEIESSSSIVEDANGVVLSFENQTRGSGTNIFVKGHREGDEIVIEGQSQRYAIPRNIPGPILMDRLTKKMPLKEGSKLEKNIFFSDLPNQFVKIRVEVKGKEEKNIENKKMSLWKIESEMSALPGMITHAWVDEKWTEKYALIPFGGMGKIERIVSTKEEALRPFDSVEIFTKSLITPSRPLSNIKKLKKALYRLKINSSQPIKLWKDFEQSVVSNQKNVWDVTVIKPEIDENVATWQLPFKGEKTDYLKETSFLEVSDPMIVELAKKAIGDEKNPVRAARKIENFVREYIQKKDLSVGFASALDTAKSRAGDCTENAVLAATLGRAAGLPTRVVIGLGYVPQGASNGGKFGFHMWAEAWIAKGLWMPMDSSLNGFDVGHIAIIKMSSLTSVSVSEIFTSIFGMFDGLQIEVVSTE